MVLELRISLEYAINNFFGYHFAVVDATGRIAVPVCLTKTKKEALEYQSGIKSLCQVINLDEFRHNRRK